MASWFPDSLHQTWRLTQTPYNFLVTHHLSLVTGVDLADALRHDFLQVFHVFRPGLVNDFGAFARDVSGEERLTLEYAVQNFFHTEGEPIGFGEARDFR